MYTSIEVVFFSSVAQNKLKTLPWSRTRKKKYELALKTSRTCILHKRYEYTREREGPKTDSNCARMCVFLSVDRCETAMSYIIRVCIRIIVANIIGVNRRPRYNVGQAAITVRQVYFLYLFILFICCWSLLLLLLLLF